MRVGPSKGALYLLAAHRAQVRVRGESEGEGEGAGKGDAEYDV